MSVRPLTACLLATALTACSTLLGVSMDDARPRDVDAADGAAAEATGKEGLPETPTPLGADGTCPADRKPCNMLCVSKRDPAYGCAADACTVCAVDRGVAACAAGACAVGSCEANRADCNKSVSDGCEADLSSDVAHCGSCTTACTSTTFGTSSCGSSACALACAADSDRVGALCVPRATLATAEARVAAGWEHTCAVRTDGTLACWGRNDVGQATPPAGRFVQVAAGVEHSCALRPDGTILCWGSNAHGEATPPAGTFTQISSGGQPTLHWFSCGLRTGGTLACWGSNRDGERIPPGGTYKAVSVGLGSACAVGTNGTLVCWGQPIADPPAGTFRQVSTGNGPCGVRVDGTILCGQLSAGVSATPRKQVATGLSHTCWRNADDTLGCNQGTPSPPNFPAMTPPQGAFRQVSSGRAHACAIRTDGTVTCWGANLDGEANAPPGTFW